MFTAPSTGSGTATTMDALIYDSTGPVQTMGGSPKATDGSAQNGKTNPNAKFSTPFGSAYHTFKVRAAALRCVLPPRCVSPATAACADCVVSDLEGLDG